MYVKPRLSAKILAQEIIQYMCIYIFTFIYICLKLYRYTYIYTLHIISHIYIDRCMSRLGLNIYADLFFVSFSKWIYKTRQQPQVPFWKKNNPKTGQKKYNERPDREKNINDPGFLWSILGWDQTLEIDPFQYSALGFFVGGGVGFEWGCTRGGLYGSWGRES